MRYIWQHIQTIIEGYIGGMPLSHFLKNYFRMHPKLGSRDRKILSEMAYCWYRCSKALPEALPFEEKLRLCLFLCETQEPRAAQFLTEEQKNNTAITLREKTAFLAEKGISFRLEDILPFRPELSAGIEEKAWLSSMLRQPRLFIRIRKQREKIEAILKDNNIPFEEISDTCLSLPNNSPVDKLLSPDTYVVQDASSQATGRFFQPAPGETWWDVCSGAGGKALLLKDLQPAINLTVSDKRETILHNLKERFRLYGHKPPQAFAMDVTDAVQLHQKLGSRLFDQIITDIPCTGAGTWARTPEQLYYFREEYIREFSARQEAITRNVVPYLKAGGSLIYITCSVFRAENEAVVDQLLNSRSLTLEKQGLINGTDINADSMFAAVFRKN